RLRRRSWRCGRAFSTRRRSAVRPAPQSVMKLQPVPGEHRYAVAVREGSDLWLALWIRRSRKGEFFIMVPRGDRDWDVHTSYHLDGNADVSGTIGRDLTMAGGSLTLTNAARVGGNLSARVRHLKDVNIADGATIAGKRDIQVRVRRSQFERPRFYLHQAVWLAVAMLVGLLGLSLSPGFFKACTQALGVEWRCLGLLVGVLAGVLVAMF